MNEPQDNKSETEEVSPEVQARAERHLRILWVVMFVFVFAPFVVMGIRSCGGGGG